MTLTESALKEQSVMGCLSDTHEAQEYIPITKPKPTRNEQGPVAQWFKKKNKNKERRREA